jgi:cell division transport system permease protein
MGSFRYIFRDTLRLITRHWGLSILTLLTTVTVLFLLGLSSLFALNLRHMVSRVEGELVVQAYLKGGSDATALAKRIRSVSYVRDVRVISPEEALDRLRAKLGNQARAVTLLGENPLPWGLEIQVEKASFVSMLVRDLVALPSVEEVVYSGQLADKLSRISVLATRVSAVIMLLGAVISSLVIFNTIRIALYSRSEEIRVMLLVGATRTYIAFPFVLQGLFLGTIGAAVANGVLAAGYAYAVNVLKLTLPFVVLLRNTPFLIKFHLILLGTGMTLGWMCSWFAVSRFISGANRPE